VGTTLAGAREFEGATSARSGSPPNNVREHPIELTWDRKSAKDPSVKEDATAAPEAAPTAEEARLERAGRLGRRVGTIFMVVFATWFVLTTVYNFAVDVFIAN
jgi:hypothetical protein